MNKLLVLLLSAPKRIYFLVPILAVFLLVGLAAPQAAASGTSSLFEATFLVDFWIPGDVGKSVLFIVEESGSGHEQTFGDFTYESSLLHNLAVSHQAVAQTVQPASMARPS